jgi:hypothetical protein
VACAPHSPSLYLGTLGRDALTALKLVCWLNTLEKRLFSAPYEGKDCDEKFQVSQSPVYSCSCAERAQTSARTCAQRSLLSFSRQTMHDKPYAALVLVAIVQTTPCCTCHINHPCNLYRPLPLTSPWLMAVHKRTRSLTCTAWLRLLAAVLPGQVWLCAG